MLKQTCLTKLYLFHTRLNYHRLMITPQMSPAPFPTSGRYSIGTITRFSKQTIGQNLYPASNIGQKSCPTISIGHVYLVWQYIQLRLPSGCTRYFGL